MKPRLKATPVLPLYTVSLALLFAGCVVNQKQFKITSHPPGATIYVDGEKRGQTNIEKLNIVFPRKQTVTLRLDKNGYQPEGMVLDMTKSPQEFFIVLHESPGNEEIGEGLKRIQSLLEALPGRIADQAKGSQ